MQIFNWEKQLHVEYSNSGGRETVTVAGKKLSFEDVCGGTTLLSHNHPEEQTGLGNLEETMFGRKPVDYTLSDARGLQGVEFTIPPLTATIGFVKESALKTKLWTYAVRFGRFNGRRSLWLVFMRPPAIPPKYTPERRALSVVRDSSSLGATFEPGAHGTIDGELTLSGTAYRGGELVMRRQIEDVALDGTVAEIKAGDRGRIPFTWTPARHDFDCMMVFKYGLGIKTSDSRTLDLFRALGGQVDQGNRFLGNRLHDFVPSDGPGVNYTLILKGRRSLQTDEDFSAISVK